MKRRDLLRLLGAAVPLSMVRDDWMSVERHMDPPEEVVKPLTADWTDVPEHKEWEIASEVAVLVSSPGVRLRDGHLLAEEVIKWMREGATVELGFDLSDGSVGPIYTSKWIVTDYSQNYLAIAIAELRSVGPLIRTDEVPDGCRLVKGLRQLQIRQKAYDITSMGPRSSRDSPVLNWDGDVTMTTFSWDDEE